MISALTALVHETLVAEKLHDELYVLKRARLLAWIHVISTSLSVFLMVMSVFTQPAIVPVMITLTAVLVGLTYLYARQGNLILSGNLLVGVIALALLASMLETGGLYSDNLLWCILLPIIAFLFTSPRYGVLWSGFVLALLTGLYVLEYTAESSYRFSSLVLGADYYFVSYLGLFVGLFGMILLFVRGNDEILFSLRRTSAALKDRKRTVEEQNAKLRLQEKELKRSNRDLELFAYVASHDLKEPLRMVNAYTQVLQRNLGPTASLKDQEYMGYVREGAERMQSMLDDLLAFSRLGREGVTQEAVDLNKVLTLVEHNLSVRLGETQGELLHGSLPALIGQRTHFVQVFQNLIANALKFSRPGVPPRIRLTTRTEPEAGHFIVSVEDNGIGIREEDLSSIFGVFQRLHTREEFEGSGIGLATVQRIMEGLEGRVEVSSTFGVGTTFHLILPLSLVVEEGVAAE